MKPLRSLIVAAATVVGATVALTLPAAADPVGGCASAFELETVANLELTETDAPPGFFADTDANDDGFVCIKRVPEAASFTGLAFDNKQKF
jgi:hypothetical protein